MARTQRTKRKKKQKQGQNEGAGPSGDAGKDDGASDPKRPKTDDSSAKTKTPTEVVVVDMGVMKQTSQPTNKQDSQEDVQEPEMRKEKKRLRQQGCNERKMRQKEERLKESLMAEKKMEKKAGKLQQRSEDMSHNSEADSRDSKNDQNTSFRRDQTFDSRSSPNVRDSKSTSFWRGQSSQRQDSDHVHGHLDQGQRSSWQQSTRISADLSGLSFFETGQPNQCLAVLQYPTEFHFFGKVSVQVIQGCVEILGYKIYPGKTFPVFSPSSSSSLSMKAAKSISELSSRSLRETLNPIFTCEGSKKNENIDTVMSKYREHTSIVLLQKIDSPQIQYISSFDFYSDVFSRGTSSIKNDTDTDLHLASSIGLHVVPEVGYRTIEVVQDMVEITENLVEYASVEEQPPVILVCGGKAVGKSTFCRYLINSFLSKQKSVGFLEGDIGQTEFTPASVISLTNVTEPLLGPPFTHVTEPHIMSFVGDLSPRDDPKRYVKTFKYVHGFYERNVKQPLIVNTMGWVKGTGLCLLLDVIRLVKPTHIVQFETKSQAKNLPFLDEEYLSENPGWCLPVESASEKKSQLMVINVRSDHSFSGKFRAANQRDMILLAYLSQLQPEISCNVIKPMHHLTPYVLPWNSVAVHVVHCKVPERQIMYALNASIVALCVASNSQMEEAHTSTNKDFPVFFSETPVCQCLGFGVIRGIDMKKRCFYILTPVSSVKLPKVNTLLRGAMPIPNDILLQGEVDDQKPYLTSEFSYTITGAGAVKIRKNLLRKCIKLKGNIM